MIRNGFTTEGTAYQRRKELLLSALSAPWAGACPTLANGNRFGRMIHLKPCAGE